MKPREKLDLVSGSASLSWVHSASKENLMKIGRLFLMPILALSYSVVVAASLASSKALVMEALQAVPLKVDPEVVLQYWSNEYIQRNADLLDVLGA